MSNFNLTASKCSDVDGLKLITTSVSGAEGKFKGAKNRDERYSGRQKKEKAEKSGEKVAGKHLVY